MKLLSTLFGVSEKKTLPNRVSVDASSISFWINQSLMFTLDWKDISKVIAYKDDLFSYDEICVGFVLQGSDEYQWTGEDMVGYKELIDYLPSVFPGIRTDWWEKVAFPAFERNQLVIWKKPTGFTVKSQEEPDGADNAAPQHT